MAALFAFLHHVAAFALFAALIVQLVNLRGTLTVDRARTIQVADMILGAAAGVLLVVGLIRVFYFEKGYYYYFQSHSFLAKFTLFIVLALASIIPTLEFLRWRTAIKAGQVPNVTETKLKSVRRIVHYELLGVVLIILFAALMAKGIG
jgi:putative membrane protein